MRGGRGVNQILSWLQKDLPILAETWLRALLTKPVLVQLGVLVGVFLLMFPVARIVVGMYRRVFQRLGLERRLLSLVNHLRRLFFRQPLQQQGAQQLIAVVHTIESLARPLAGYLLIQAGASACAGIQGVGNGLLVRLAPLFLLWMAFRWVQAFLAIWMVEETFVAFHKRLLRPLFWLAFVLQLFGRLESSIALIKSPFLTLGGAAISLKNLFLAGLTLWVFVKISRGSREFLQEGLLPKLKTSPALNNTLATFVSYMLIGLGFFLSISTLGFNGSSLTVLFGALTVGIGFGLQSIINNFVSGLILLAEQSIAPGDVIEVDNKVCVVEHIRIRSTTVRTYDNIELRVPNSKLLGDIVHSLTGEDTKSRTKVRVGVSYQSDPLTVHDALLKAAKNTEKVLEDPAPVVQFVDFGDNALIFDVFVWVENPRLFPSIQSQLRFRIWYALKSVGVEMPFPQRDLNLGAGWESFAHALANDGKWPAAAPVVPPTVTPTNIPAVSSRAELEAVSPHAQQAQQAQSEASADKATEELPPPPMPQSLMPQPFPAPSQSNERQPFFAPPLPEDES